ncbi:MAG: VC2046/SO_2500 family protein [Succinatimonas sp.]|jgi:hypothetical protein|nr:hypothetical protein [Succinatimonas sp.]MDD5868530.1 VC2046/SO_2500 family protein [Succinatimonas sp.]MDY5721922.1 VC2046/SO_2500 family protein [Succinivibrio sp.]
MLTPEIRNELLVDEMQLGQRLNEDVQTQNHADFALMLSMLSQDVTDQAIFSDEKQKVKEVDLRAKFKLPKEQKQYATASDFDRGSEMTALFARDGFTSVFLAQCLCNEPLTQFDRDIKPEVFSQLAPLKQEKLRKVNQGKVLTYEKIHETGDGFDILDVINSSRIEEKIATSV